MLMDTGVWTACQTLVRSRALDREGPVLAAPRIPRVRACAVGRGRRSTAVDTIAPIVISTRAMERASRRAERRKKGES